MPDGDPLRLGQDNYAYNVTFVQRNAPADQLGEFLEALHVENLNGGGITALANTNGVTGSFAGVSGSASTGPGVIGFTLDPSHGGVQGWNVDGNGIIGISKTGNAVLGIASEAPGVGVQGTAGYAGIGVQGITTGVNPATGLGGIGVAGYSADGMAGFFSGPVEIQGDLSVRYDANVDGTLYATVISAGSKYFRIDHPLDPATKYLLHSAVESPDMKNIYDGVVTLDARGEATVELPAWFQALNSDFRYQLTAIGAPQPTLHVAEEVADNRFRIAGGIAGMKASWQVTGIRKDALAEARRTPVEQDKPSTERGRYLHPELYGETPDRTILPRPIRTQPWPAEPVQQLEEHRRWMEEREQP